MNPLMLILAVLADLIRETLPDMVDRLPAATVQKFRDALQAIEQEQANHGQEHAAGDAAELDPFELGAPPFVIDLVNWLKSDLQRRAEHDNATAAIATRTALALEGIAQALNATQLNRPAGT